MAEKAVLITGCSAGGLGDALAQAFHAKGYHVFATARSLSKMSHLRDMGLKTLALDVNKPETVSEAVEKVKKATGGSLDILVNNSAIGQWSSLNICLCLTILTPIGGSMPLLDVSLSAARSTYETNVLAPIAMVQAFAPLLIAAQGTVVNIGSIAAIMPLPWQAIYNSSKAALHHLTYTLRLELAPLGVHVTLVVLGGIDSKFMDNLPDASLPNNSFYIHARDNIEPYLNGTGTGQTSVAAKPAVYADDIVRGIIGQKEPQKKIWAGAGASRVWFVSTFLWYSVWVSELLKNESFRHSTEYYLLSKIIGFASANKVTPYRDAKAVDAWYKFETDPNGTNSSSNPKRCTSLHHS